MYIRRSFFFFFGKRCLDSSLCPAYSACSLTCRRAACVGSPYLQHCERDSQMILQSLSFPSPSPSLSLPHTLSLSRSFSPPPSGFFSPSSARKQGRTWSQSPGPEASRLYLSKRKQEKEGLCVNVLASTGVFLRRDSPTLYEDVSESLILLSVGDVPRYQAKNKYFTASPLLFNDIIGFAF